MVPTTRRALLQGATGLTAALAGCSGLLNGSADSSRTASPTSTDNVPAGGSTTDPETLLLRVDTDSPPIWTAPSDSKHGKSLPGTGDDRWRDSIVVDEDSLADRIKVHDTVDRDRVESFLDATSFDEETIYIEMGAVEACFRLDLCQVRWTATKVSTDYTRRVRPYYDRCAADEYVVEARLIRIPEAIDANDVTTYSSSIGTGECERQQPRSVEEHGGDGTTPREKRNESESTTIDSEGGQ